MFNRNGSFFPNKFNNNNINTPDTTSQSSVETIVEISRVHTSVIIDVAPAWTDGIIIADNQIGIVETGLNLLTDVDILEVSFRRVATTTGEPLWAAPIASIRIEDILRDKQQGVLATHFDNQFLAFDNVTDVDLASGRIRFRAETQSSTFRYEITRIGFKKSVVGADPEIGFVRKGPPNLEGVVQGLSAVYGRTIPNGAIDYPIFASRWPSLVAENGVDLIYPTNIEGAFDRNLGGNALSFGEFQTHAQARNPSNPVNTSVNSGGGKTVRAVVTSAGETRPSNFGLQWYFVMDDYMT